MVRAQSSLSHHRHARSVPRDGLPRACLMFACPQRACGAAPPHRLLATPARLVCAAKKHARSVLCVCLFCHGWATERGTTAAWPRARLPSPQRGGRFTHPALLIACTSVTPPAPPLGQHSGLTPSNTPCPSTWPRAVWLSPPSFCFLLWLGQPRRLIPSCSLPHHHSSTRSTERTWL
jgi:hypothetical protein